MTPRTQIAVEAWGEVPDWVMILIDACDQPGSSQNQVAKLLGFSAPVVSQVLRKDYRGNMANFEYRVRAVFMPDMVQCPAIGPIGTPDCLRWQDEAKAGLRSATPHMVRMHNQCTRCPRYIEAQQL